MANTIAIAAGLAGLLFSLPAQPQGVQLSAMRLPPEEAAGTAFLVFTLMTNSNLVGCFTGKSARLAITDQIIPRLECGEQVHGLLVMARTHLARMKRSRF
jgi:hypothetical protein